MTKVFWVLVAVYAGAVAWAAAVLPERVPTHWSGFGSPDAVGSRSSALTGMVIGGVVVVGLFGALQVFVGRSERLRGVNLPHREFWTRPERLAETRARLRQDFAVLGSLALGILLTAVGGSVDASSTPDHRLPVWAMVVVLVLLAAVIARVLFMAAVRWRPREGDLGSG